jgi:hypothetical protein
VSLRACPLCADVLPGPTTAPIVDHLGEVQGIDQFVACAGCGWEAGDPGEDWLPVVVLRRQWCQRLAAVASW